MYAYFFSIILMSYWTNVRKHTRNGNINCSKAVVMIRSSLSWRACQSEPQRIGSSNRCAFSTKQTSKNYISCQGKHYIWWTYWMSKSIWSKLNKKEGKKERNVASMETENVLCSKKKKKQFNSSADLSYRDRNVLGNTDKGFRIDVYWDFLYFGHS